MKPPPPKISVISTLAGILYILGAGALILRDSLDIHGIQPETWSWCFGLLLSALLLFAVAAIIAKLAAIERHLDKRDDPR